MDNNVVLGLCNGMLHFGIGALRFNYRGIGLSEGSTSADWQAVEDAAAMLQYLSERREVDARRLGIAGYSFGAGLSAHRCR